MSMFHLQKTFEQSLRSTNHSTVTTSIEQTPLKTEIHRGCTGKAHACGTIKNRIVKLKAVESKNHRKNSLSSETISDSGSEVSNLETWTENNIGLRRSNKLSATPSQNANKFRRRTTENVISVDEVDRTTTGNLIQQHLDRHPDVGDDYDELRKTSLNSLNSSLIRRSFRSGSANGKNHSQSPVRPPWKNVYTTRNMTVTPPQLGFFRGDIGIRSSVRSSMRRRGDNWETIWMKSFGLRSDGGVYKTLETLQADKVSKLWLFLVIIIFFYV